MRHRKRHHALQRPVRSVAAQGRPAPEGQPYEARRIDGQPVRHSRVGGHGRERPAVRDRSRVQVEVEDVDAAGRAVDVVHAAAVQAPVQAVRDRHAGQHGVHGEVGVEAIERARAWPLIQRHRARPEPAGAVAGAPAGAVAGAIVHPVLGPVRLHRGLHLELLRVQIQAREATGDREHQASVEGACESTHGPADGDVPAGAGGGREGVDPAAHDVHPEQALVGGVPTRPFAQVRPCVQHQLDGGRGHERRLRPVFAAPKPRRSQPGSKSWMRPPVRGCAAQAS